MNERPYRAVGDPAALATRERDAGTGRRTADRSDKGRSSRVTGRRRGLVVAAVIIGLVLVGGVAVAVTNGGTDDGQASGGSGATGAGSTGDADSGDPSGSYELTATVIEEFWYPPAPQSNDLVGSSRTVSIDIECDGSTCTIDSQGVLPEGSYELDGGELHIEARNPSELPANCQSQESVATVDLVVDEDGGLSGTLVTDLDPPTVACDQSPSPPSTIAGERVTSSLEGRRV